LVRVEDQSFSDLSLTECPNRIAIEDLANKNVDELPTMTSGWLKDMELVRTKSKFLNGRLSGYLKDRIACTRSVIGALIDRLKDTGDITFLRRRNDELASQLREAKREEPRLNSYLKEADNKIDQLNSELFDLRRRIGSEPLFSEHDRTFLPTGGGGPSTAGGDRTPADDDAKRKKKRKSRDLSTVVESLQECDVQLQAMARCDERIAKFEGLLAQMRADLYGLIEVLSNRIEKTATAAAPPKRGVPRIVSDIQLAPPRTNPNAQDDSNPRIWIEIFGLGVMDDCRR